MALQGLGYAGFGSDALDDWRQFGTGLLGLQAVERGNALLAFRMDDRKQRIVIDRALGNGTRFFGWEVADAAALEALAARLEAAGVAVTSEPQALADARRVRRLISFGDPAGNRLEAFYGAEIDDTPFRPGRNISGFRTGPLGLGHAVLTVENIEPMMAFYMNVLGFRLSERIITDPQSEELLAAFLFCSNKAHDIAFVKGPNGKLHHFAFWLDSWHDILRAGDILARNKVKIDIGPTRHGITRGTTIYFFGPNGNRNEVFSGGYMTYADFPCITWTADQIGKAIFYIQQEVNDRFSTYLT